MRDPRDDKSSHFISFSKILIFDLLMAIFSFFRGFSGMTNHHISFHFQKFCYLTYLWLFLAFLEFLFLLFVGFFRFLGRSIAVRRACFLSHRYKHNAMLQWKPFKWLDFSKLWLFQFSTWLWTVFFS